MGKIPFVGIYVPVGGRAVEPVLWSARRWSRGSGDISIWPETRPERPRGLHGSLNRKPAADSAKEQTPPSQSCATWTMPNTGPRQSTTTITHTPIQTARPHLVLEFDCKINTSPATRITPLFPLSNFASINLGLNGSFIFVKKPARTAEGVNYNLIKL